MGGIKTISIIVAANIKGLETGLGKANKSLASFASKSARLGSMLSFGVTAPLVAMGKQAFDTFSQFENSMMKVNTVTGATTEEFKMLTSEAKRLGATTQFTASQVADLQLVLGRKGFDPTQIKNMEQSILDLALATGEDLSLAAETVSTSINAFQLESSHATRVANTLASAAANSSIQLNTFATAFGHAGASANAVGVDLDRLAAMMGVLMDNGIKASKAGTGLRKIFMKLNKEGVDFTTVLDLATHGEMGLEKAMKLAGVTSANQLLILANNKEKVAELTKEYKTNTGRLKEMADAMGKTTFAKVKKMQSAIESMNIELGALLADAITPIIDKVTNLAGQFSLLDNDTKQLIITIGGVMVALGPVMMGIGALISLLNPVTIGIAALATAFISLAHSSRKTKSPLEQEQNALNNLAARAMSANEGTEKRIKLIKELQEKYPNFLTNLNAEKVENEAIKKALDGANESLLKKMRFQAESKKIQALMATQNEAATKVIEAEDKANEGLRNTYGKLGVDLNENLSTQQKLNRVLDDGGRFVQIAMRDGKKYVEGQVQGIKISREVKSATAENSEELGQATESYNTATDALKDYLKFLEEIGSTAGQILEDPVIDPVIDPVDEGGTDPIEYDGSSLLPYLTDYDKFLKAIEDKTQAARDRVNEFWGGIMTNFAEGLSSIFSKQTEMVTVMVDGVEEIQERTLTLGQKFKNFVKEFIKSIGQMIVKALILAALMSIIGGGAPSMGMGGAMGGSNFMANFKNIAMGGNLFSGEGLANGGKPALNKLSLVGENGPELFNPGSTSGTIIPNHALGGGSVIPDVRISGDDLLIVFDRANRRKARR